VPTSADDVTIGATAASVTVQNTQRVKSLVCAATGSLELHSTASLQIDGAPCLISALTSSSTMPNFLPQVDCTIAGPQASSLVGHVMTTPAPLRLRAPFALVAGAIFSWQGAGTVLVYSTLELQSAALSLKAGKQVQLERGATWHFGLTASVALDPGTGVALAWNSTLFLRGDSSGGISHSGTGASAYSSSPVLLLVLR
jgi:hypothetical protein